MNLFTRSIKYLIRKWKTSLLLLLILFVTSVLVLSGLAVLNAEEEKTEELKEATGTSFSVERNYESGGMETDEKGNTYLTSDAITEEMIEEIASIEGIKGYNATVDSISSILKDGEYLYQTDRYVGDYLVDSQTLSVTNINTQYSNYFTSHIFELVEGEHITQDTENAIIVSEEYAKKNNLKIGDTVTVVNDPMNDDPFVDVEIIGIFRVMGDSADESDDKKIYDLSGYFVYNDYVFLSGDLADKLYVNYDDVGRGQFNVVDFYVENPDNLDSIIQNVQNIKDINWNNFYIYANDEVYQNASSSINNTSTLIIALMVIAIVVSVIIISMIIYMNTKGRRREIGILLSIGKSKAVIISQYILEIFIIAILSFAGSYFFSDMIAGGLGDMFGKIRESVVITTEQFIIVSVIGMIILITIVILSCSSILKNKPREILSQLD